MPDGWSSKPLALQEAKDFDFAIHHGPAFDSISPIMSGSLRKGTTTILFGAKDGRFYLWDVGSYTIDRINHPSGLDEISKTLSLGEGLDGLRTWRLWSLNDEEYDVMAWAGNKIVS